MNNDMDFSKSEPTTPSVPEVPAEVPEKAAENEAWLPPREDAAANTPAPEETPAAPYTAPRRARDTAPTIPCRGMGRPRPLRADGCRRTHLTQRRALRIPHPMAFRSPRRSRRRCRIRCRFRNGNSRPMPVIPNQPLLNRLRRIRPCRWCPRSAARSRWNSSGV